MSADHAARRAVDRITTAIAEAAERGPRYPLHARIRAALHDARHDHRGQPLPAEVVAAIDTTVAAAISDYLLDHPGQLAALRAHGHRFANRLPRPPARKRRRR